MELAGTQVGLRPAVWVSPGENPFPPQLNYARAAEEHGFDGVFFGERLLHHVGHEGSSVYRSSHTDLLVTLTAVAAQTARIKIGSLVLVLPFRHPVPLAKELASLDLLSHGRLILGVGSGWSATEFAALGVDRAERASRFEESIRVLRTLWAGGVVSNQGRHYPFADVAIDPLPARAGGPPLWLGSFLPARRQLEELSPDLERVLRRVGRLADAWCPVVYSQLTKRTVTAEVLAGCWHRVLANARTAGRTVELAISHWYYVLEDSHDEQTARRDLDVFFTGTFDQARDTYLIGTAEEIAEKLVHLLSLTGRPHWLIFSMLGARRRQLDLLTERVLPLVGRELARLPACVEPSA